MAVTLRVGEAGKRHRMAFSFDMSSNTSLGLVYTKSDGAETQLSVTPTLGTSSTTIDGQSAAANTWAYYDFVPGDIVTGDDGDWIAEFTYTNTASTPDDIFKNLIPITLTVSP